MPKIFGEIVEQRFNKEHHLYTDLTHIKTDAKELHQYHYAQLRGLEKVKVQCLLVAAVQIDLKT